MGPPSRTGGASPASAPALAPQAGPGAPARGPGAIILRSPRSPETCVRGSAPRTRGLNPTGQRCPPTPSLRVPELSLTQPLRPRPCRTRRERLTLSTLWVGAGLGAGTSENTQPGSHPRGLSPRGTPRCPSCGVPVAGKGPSSQRPGVIPSLPSPESPSHQLPCPVSILSCLLGTAASLLAPQHHSRLLFPSLNGPL